MNTRAILKHLRSEQKRITRAIETLESLSNSTARKVRRQYRRTRRTMSKAARLRISRAKKAWWAARKKAKA